MDKKTLNDLINHHVQVSLGDPSRDSVAAQNSRKALADVIDGICSEDIEKNLNMLEDYILNISQENMKKYPDRMSGAEGNLLFKINQIKKLLQIKEK